MQENPEINPHIAIDDKFEHEQLMTQYGLTAQRLQHKIDPAYIDLMVSLRPVISLLRRGEVDPEEFHGRLASVKQASAAIAGAINEWFQTEGEEPEIMAEDHDWAILRDCLGNRPKAIVPIARLMNMGYSAQLTGFKALKAENDELVLIKPVLGGTVTIKKK